MYKLLDQGDSFPFSVVRIPNIESNIPQIIFYLTMKGMILRFYCSTLCLREFITCNNKALKVVPQVSF